MADATMPKPRAIEPTKPPVKPTPATAAVEPTAKADVDVAPAVTVTGCLERDKESFRLKDTSGEDAPTSRSWKSGFLKRRRSSIELVDPINRLALTNYVGQRVAATGVLVNREMRARSLRRVAPSCD